MKQNTTIVYDITVTNLLLARDHKLYKIRPNKTVPNRLVFIFYGDLKDEVNQILIDLGKKEG